MDVTVLAIPDCPGVALLEDRLAAAAAGLPGIRVSHRVITGEAEAESAGMHGSPTLLVGGTDPFAVPGQSPGLACRLYPQDDGSLAVVPPVGELRRVLTEAEPE
ncbi:MAG: thioredoxin family protein [Trebonia sp.]